MEWMGIRNTSKSKANSQSIAIISLVCDWAGVSSRRAILTAMVFTINSVCVVEVLSISPADTGGVLP